ncbi:MAG: peptidase dimerization domain-containing protein [Spirochaetaceae bacterium]|nr:peptidase dimerization domain-containing protein [Spirochaetaceae bacterium]
MAVHNWFEISGITDKQAADLMKTGVDLWDRAEPGFRETATHEYLAGKFANLGFRVEPFDGIPGFIATVPDSDPGIAVIADMDALPNPGDENGAYIHSCGHHMQTADIYGSARLLHDIKSPALDSLAFIAVPAEEYIDLEDREELRVKGRIKHLSGKQELLERGVFKRFEKVVSTHAAGFGEPEFISSVLGMGGFEVLRFRFTGKAAHAGAQPHKGINAQNAASLFLQACAFLRESFNESDHIRIHPLLTLPRGQSVNIIPDTAFVETYVRAAGQAAINATTEKLKAAALGCARSIGAEADIETIPGYAPFIADRDMHSQLCEVTEELGITFIEEEYSAASSDMGDVSQALPSIMLGLPGVNGLFHNPGFRVTDEKAAYLLPSVVLARYLEKLVGAAD